MLEDNIKGVNNIVPINFAFSLNYKNKCIEQKGNWHPATAKLIKYTKLKTIAVANPLRGIVGYFPPFIE